MSSLDDPLGGLSIILKFETAQCDIGNLSKSKCPKSGGSRKTCSGSLPIQIKCLHAQPSIGSLLCQPSVESRLLSTTNLVYRPEEGSCGGSSSSGLSFLLVVVAVVVEITIHNTLLIGHGLQELWIYSTIIVLNGALSSLFLAFQRAKNQSIWRLILPMQPTI